MNVLITCAGRRNYLINCFQEALLGEGLVFAVDSSAHAPSLQDTDQAFIIPSIEHPDYVDSLVSICQDHQVRLLMPVHDLELPILAKARDRFLSIGTIPLVSSPEIVEACFDKWQYQQLLASYGLIAPQTYLSIQEAEEAIAHGSLNFPLLLKPRWGTTSLEIQTVADVEELELTYRLIQKRLATSSLAQFNIADPERCILIQEKLHGREYGLDIINNLEGQYVGCLVREKLRMLSGQTDRAIAVVSESLEKLGAAIGENLHHIGSLDCDVIITDQGCYVIDLNPRIGGGYPFSHCAGANLPAVLMAWATGKPHNPQWLEIQPTLISRYDQFQIINVLEDSSVNYLTSQVAFSN